MSNLLTIMHNGQKIPIPAIKGDPGKDGLTPHIGANGNWFIGDEDTGVSAGGDLELVDTLDLTSGATLFELTDRQYTEVFCTLASSANLDGTATIKFNDVSGTGYDFGLKLKNAYLYARWCGGYIHTICPRGTDLLPYARAYGAGGTGINKISTYLSAVCSAGQVLIFAR